MLFRDGLSVRDIMNTALVTAREDEILLHVDLKMRLTGVRHLPIVDASYRAVGLVSHLDILCFMASHINIALPVREIMNPCFHAVHPGTPAREAATILIDQRTSALLVLGEGGRLLGLVTETDFVGLALLALSKEQAVNATRTAA